MLNSVIIVTKIFELKTGLMVIFLTLIKVDVMSFHNRSPTCPVLHRGKSVDFLAGFLYAIFPVFLPLLD